MNSSLILYIELFLLIAIATIRANCQATDKPLFPGEIDFVSSLPNVSLPDGQNYSSVRHYSGYLQSSENFENASIPYWFFESQSENWKAQPLVLWLGNYVSAMHGALIGISPIRMNVDGTLNLNKFAWNKQANLLIFESFPEVGFPSKFYDNFMQNDTVAAEFTLDLIERFYEKFPQISENSFYIAGEGLVSFHIGILAKKIVKKSFPSKFKGIVIGNGVYNLSVVVNAHFQYIYRIKKDLYENEFWDNLKKLCCPSKYCSFWSKADDPCTFQHCQSFTYENPELIPEPHSESELECNKFYQKSFYSKIISNKMLGQKPLDLHNIHENCVPDASENANCTRYIISKKIYDWFNGWDSNALREALHIQEYTTESDSWRPSKEEYQQIMMRQYSTLHGHLMFLLSKNIRILLYTGQFDGVVSPFNSRWLLDELPLKPMHHSEQDWVIRDTETVGYRTRFCGGLTFYGITGAGHMVAEDQPEAAFEMLKEFLLEDQSPNSLSHWGAGCPQTVPSCPFCNTNLEPEKEDKFSDFWIDSLNRYYTSYSTSPTL